MPIYLVEAFLPRGHAGSHRGHELAADAAAAESTRDGTPVRVVGSIYVPDDETCLISVEAPSAAVVHTIVRRAGLRVLRVVEAVVTDRLVRSS